MKKPIIAAFDFDGTITYCDTLLPFLFHTVGFFKGCLYLLCLVPSFVLFFFSKYNRNELKEKVLTKYLRGLSQNFLQERGNEYATSHILELLIKSSAVKRLRWHQEQGHRCILISANLDLYLKPWSKLMNFQDCISSVVKIDQQGKATGLLDGKNCRGEEKTRRLQQLLGPKENYLLYAYGDSAGDKELLAFADYPFYRTFG